MAEPTKKTTQRAGQKTGAGASFAAKAPSGRATVKSTVKPTSVKTGSNAYKRGKLSRNARFSPRKIKWTPIIIISCVLLAFVLAMVFGNYLNKLVEESQSTVPPTSADSNIVPPSADKVSPRKELHAYFVDLTGADPETSLSELTAVARSKGNALLVEIKVTENELVYSSDKAEELGYSARENLKLSRLNNHFEYYDDFAVGYFVSDFSAKLDTEKALKLQMNEILILKEATEKAFDQIIIEFSSSLTKNDLIHYEAYLLNLKLACPDVPIGIKLEQDFLLDSDNAGSIASLLGIADFFALDFGTQSVEKIKPTLTSLIYFAERYDCVVMLSGADEAALAEKIVALENKGIENYIVK